MCELDVRMPGVAALRVLVAAVTVMIVAGCSVAGAPQPAAPGAPSATPTAVSPTPRSTPAAAGSATARATQTAPAVGLAMLTGMWSGHTRSLNVSTAGIGHETVFDGCCTSQLDMTFRLSNPRGSAARATATVTVTAVVVSAGLDPAPKVGQTGTVDLVDGVLTNSLDGFTYCNEAAAARSACGA